MTLVRRRFRKSSKLAKKRRRTLLFRICVLIFAVIILFAGLAYVSFFEEFNISNIYVNGNSAITEKSVKEFIEKKISGNYFFIFSKSNIFLYPKKDIETSLLETFKNIKEINISIKDLQSIFITIDERKPFALWCDKKFSNENEKDDNNCYFLDKDGFIFTKAPNFSGNVYFRYFSILSTNGLISELKNNPVGRQFMPKEEFRQITFFLSSIADIKLIPIELYEINDTDYEMRLDDGGRILFGKKQNLSFVFDNIQSVFESDEFNKENLSNLDYADFRFGNKVYFKFK